jgi:competence protein ComEA
MRSSPKRNTHTTQRAWPLFKPNQEILIMIRQLIATVLAVFALNAFAAADANQASRADLESVKGIGPGLSAKILKAREAGNFKNWADLVERVGGIGPGNATRLSQAGLTVGGTGYDGSAAAPVKSAKADKMGKSGAPKKGKKSDKTAEAA